MKSKRKPPLRWIGEDTTASRPPWLPESIRELQLTLRTNDVMATVQATKAGMGVSRLPCLVGESEPELSEFVAGVAVPQVPVWLLMHADMRRVHRIRVFSEFVTTAVRRRIGGENPP